MKTPPNRQKHTAALLNEHGQSLEEFGAIVPARRSRQLQRSRSLIGEMFRAATRGEHDTAAAYSGMFAARFLLTASISGTRALCDDDPRMKNVKQTELVIELKEAIVRVARHFCSVAPERYKAVTMHV